MKKLSAVALYAALLLGCSGLDNLQEWGKKVSHSFKDFKGKGVHTWLDAMGIVETDGLVYLEDLAEMTFGEEGEEDRYYLEKVVIDEKDGAESYQSVVLSGEVPQAPKSKMAMKDYADQLHPGEVYRVRKVSGGKEEVKYFKMGEKSPHGNKPVPAPKGHSDSKPSAMGHPAYLVNASNRKIQPDKDGVFPFAAEDPLVRIRFTDPSHNGKTIELVLTIAGGSPNVGKQLKKESFTLSNARIEWEMGTPKQQMAPGLYQLRVTIPGKEFEDVLLFFIKVDHPAGKSGDPGHSANDMVRKVTDFTLLDEKGKELPTSTAVLPKVATVYQAPYGKSFVVKFDSKLQASSVLAHLKNLEMEQSFPVMLFRLPSQDEVRWVVAGSEHAFAGSYTLTIGDATVGIIIKA